MGGVFGGGCVCFVRDISDSDLSTGSGTSLTPTPATVTITPVTYSNGASYQTAGGSNINLYEVDFTGLNLVEAAGTEVSFGVEGTGTGAYWFNSASNAALSGSPQDGADGVMSEYSWSGSGNPVYVGPFDSTVGGWDKPSDINVQVVADVPEPASLTLLAAGMVGFGLMRRRRRATIPA